MTMRPPVTDLPILLENVSFVVRDVTILDRIDLTLAAGAPTVVIGPNGAGKTTLLRLAMGLIRPSTGHVTWGGRADAPSNRRAFVFQRPVMLRRSAEALYWLRGRHADGGLRHLQLPALKEDLGPIAELQRRHPGNAALERLHGQAHLRLEDVRVLQPIPHVEHRALLGGAAGAHRRTRRSPPPRRRAPWPARG